MGRIVCFGELLLRLTAPGRELLLQTGRLDVHVGGAEANVAVGLGRLGHDCVMISRVPDNALGDAAAGHLRRYGVSTDGVATGPGRMGLYFLSPGAGHVYAERVLIGFLLVFVWYGVIALTVLGGRVLPFTEVSGAVAKPWDLAVAALALLVTFVLANRISPGFDFVMPARRASAPARRGRVA